MRLKVALAADHGGFILKVQLVQWLENQDYEVMDFGAEVFNASDDYPDFAVELAKAVSSGQADRGILVCGSGVGASVAANKFPGIRAAVCHDTYSAHQGVEHDDMNILCLGSRVVGRELARELVKSFLEARFSGEERHLRRLKKVVEIEGRRLGGSVEVASGPPVTSRAGAGTRKKGIRALERILPAVNLGNDLMGVRNLLADFEKKDLVARIWRRDHTVWKPAPAEISDRLGWLDVTDKMVDHILSLKAFAGEIQDAGFRHVVVLGMGGSSLGPEVLKRTFGSVPGYPELIVLDSTVPGWVDSIARSIDVKHTVFLVSSKSGGTAETMSLYKFFRNKVEQEIGNLPAGSNFVAITDPGTTLGRLAAETGFRRVFENPPDIGGRYSVLSFFGLVPAALAGIDVSALISRASKMKEGCAPRVPVLKNGPLCLGAIMGLLAQHGRDKLTLMTSPSISSFGLWVEQLIAESTGKEGKGIVPVVGEPLVDPRFYGTDRLFVYLRMDGDDNEALEKSLWALKEAGHPIVNLQMGDSYDLGAEFFRWEFATAVAGAVLGINPFDQPDVQESKNLAGKTLAAYRSSGKLPEVKVSSSLEDLFSKARPGDYLAIMAFLDQTPAVDAALMGLRLKAMEKAHIATLCGYGPRYLHSTGQLYKGGPDKGLFVQMVDDSEMDLSSPDDPFSFGVLTRAEALGDLQAMKARGRRVVRLDVGNGCSAAIEKAAGELA
jgi:RpiB/LacA/LacB family sugar-phosphate isomerase